MKIILCTEFHHDRGGGYAFAIDSQRLLEAHGHEVIPFAAHHPDNVPSRYEDQFIEYDDLMDVVSRREWLRAPTAMARLISNREAAAALRRSIERYRPDLVHTHIIATYLTQSVWAAASDAGVPVVHTLHDYKLLCPDTHLFCRGAVCERCRGGRYFHCLLRRCKRGSLAASAAAVAQAYVQRSLRRHERCVAAFVAPSAFIAAKHSDFGLPASKLHHIPNFTWPTRRLPRRSAGSGFLYCGRLSEEKGVAVLVEAARLVPEAEVVLAGSGDLRGALGPRPPANMRFLGQVPREHVPALMADARALIVPSIWYENCSLSVLEAFAAGAPVIGSALGGLPEQIDSGANGLLVPPDDAPALAEAMRSLHRDAHLALRMGAAAKAKADRTYSPQAHYDSLMRLYGSLVAPS